MESKASELYLIRKGNKINKRGFDFEKLYSSYSDAREELNILERNYPHKVGFYQIYDLEQAIDILVSEVSSEAIQNTRKGLYDKN
jgi:Ni2+-binding GTPase involved in maturation of urease and hydrogenase